MRIDDVSPTLGTFSGSLDHFNQSVSGKGLCIALSPDGARSYLGGHSGVWRSDDGGATWFHPEWRPAVFGGPPAPGALPLTNVYDLVIDPANPDVVLAACGRDGRIASLTGVYRTTDGGATWTLAHRFVDRAGTVGLAGAFGPAPDDGRTVYAAGETAVAVTTDGGVTWTESTVPAPGGPVWHVAAGPARTGGRRVYAVGSRFWYSIDGGTTWNLDPAPMGVGPSTDGAGSSARPLAVNPADDGTVYLVRDDLTFWKGVFPPPPSTAPGQWTRLTPPPIAGGTDSGGTFVVPHRSPEGAVSLYVSDRRSVHGVGGEPVSSTSWIRSEDAHCHVDPHGVAVTPDFRPWWAPGPAPPTHGRAVLVNDGGVNVSTDGMKTWINAAGLSTLNVVNVGVATVPGGRTALTFGAGDNNGFSSGDGGATWQTQGYLGGDNDCSFADPRQPTRMVLFAPRSVPANGVAGEIYLFVSGDGSNPPNTAFGSPDLRRVPGPPPVTDVTGSTTRGWNVVSHFFSHGYRPLVLTGPGEQPKPDGDLVTIRFTGRIGVDAPLLLRTTALSTIKVDTDWVTSATADGPGVKAFQVGPPLPDPLISAVQASGGHAAPTFYVGNAAPTTLGTVGSMGLWKLAPGAAAWQQVVPPPAPAPVAGPTIARRFFVDPYRPNLVYVLGSDHVYRTDDGGASWVVDQSLEKLATGAGTFPFAMGDTGNPAEAVLRDMQFDPTRPGFRLAAGVAGVFWTADGRTWQSLLPATAVGIQPTTITYDPVACDRAVYVGTSNRGVLRLSPLPPDWDFPRGSLRATVGHISLLRIHDLGTGFGPPEDFTDSEVIVLLDSEPEKAFALPLRQGAHRAQAAGMVELLRDCFSRRRPVRIEFLRTGCRIGSIVRVIEQS